MSAPRRSSFVALTCLPPAPEEIAAFVTDPSPRYGERWGRRWLADVHDDVIDQIVA